MRVSVEDTVDHDLAQQAVQQCPRQLASVDTALCDERVRATERDTIEKLHHQDALGCEVVEQSWQTHLVRRTVLNGRGRDGGEVARLDVEVQLLAQRRGKSVGQVDNAEVTC